MCNGYDTKIRSDSGGMYLEMGSIGTADLMRLGAYGGATYIDSFANRPIYMRTYGYTWSYFSNSSFNPANSPYWNQYSDHRIK